MVQALWVKAITAVVDLYMAVAVAAVQARRVQITIPHLDNTQTVVLA